MNLTNKELATGLNVPKSRISEWRERGMPNDSIAAASAWRLSHAPPRGVNAQELRAAQAPQLPAIAGEGDENWEARLNRTRKVELGIFLSLQSALAKGDVVVLQKLQAAHIAAVKEIAAAERIALDVRTQSKDLLRAEEVRAVVREVCGVIRNRIESLPIQERSRCNPTNPEVAQQALKEWVHRTLVSISTAETAF